MKQTRMDSTVKRAGALSIIPGLGQFYNKQTFKGIIFLLIFFSFLFEMYIFGVEAIQGLITLGTVPGRDHSLFLMIDGTIQLLIILVFLIFYVANIYDAINIAKLRMEDNTQVNYTMKDILYSTFDNGFPYILTSFAYLAMIFTVLFPVIVTIFTAFTNYNLHNIPPANLVNWVGFQTFIDLISLSSYRDTFFSVFSWTIIWTLGATTLQLIIGIFTAIVLDASTIKYKRFIGVILLLPWAVPAFITVMSFSNIFNDSLGAINTQVIPFLNNFIPFFDIGRIPWKTDPFWSKTALILIQGWLGYPYIFTLTSSLLQSIPSERYEAADIDGANAWQKFRYITFPHILTIAAPVFVTQYTGNFNKFSVIYLFNEGGPGSVGNNAGSTDILVSWIYKLTTGSSPQYNVASAVTVIISIVVVGVSVFMFKKLNAFETEG